MRAADMRREADPLAAIAAALDAAGTRNVLDDDTLSWETASWSWVARRTMDGASVELVGTSAVPAAMAPDAAATADVIASTRDQHVAQPTLGNRLSGILREKGLSQRDLAQLMGVTEAAVSRWCRDKREPRASTLRAMATVLGCSCDDLLGATPNHDAWPMGVGLACVTHARREW